VSHSVAAVTIIAASVLLRATSLSAQQKQLPAPDSTRDPRAVQPERPTVATHAGTVSRGWLEIESGVERDQVDAHSTAFASPTVFKVGITSHAQLGLFANLLRAPGRSLTLDDVALGLKWRLLDDAPLVGDFALLPIVKFPIRSSDGSTGTTDVSLVAISSHQFGAVAMDLNAEYTRRTGDGSISPKNGTLWTASFGGPVARGIGWVGELFGLPATSGPAGEDATIALLAGPTFLARSWLSLDAGVIVPIRGPQAHALYAGVVYNVGRLWGGAD